MQILWSNYFLVVYAFLDSVLLGSQNCNFKKLLLTFTKQMSLQLLFSLLGLFGSKIHAETGGKKSCLLFSCAQNWLRCCHCPSDLLCLLKLQSALNSTFYASVTCTHAKTEQLSTRPILSYRILKMEFSVQLLKYMFDVKRKLLSFSKNGVFQHLFHFCL